VRAFCYLCAFFSLFLDVRLVAPVSCLVSAPIDRERSTQGADNALGASGDTRGCLVGDELALQNRENLILEI